MSTATESHATRRSQRPSSIHTSIKVENRTPDKIVSMPEDGLGSLRTLPKGRPNRVGGWKKNRKRKHFRKHYIYHFAFTWVLISKLKLWGGEYIHCQLTAILDNRMTSKLKFTLTFFNFFVIIWAAAVYFFERKQSRHICNNTDALLVPSPSRPLHLPRQRLDQ